MVVRSKEQWLDLFERHESSGLSAAQFCRDKALCTRYFSKRKQQLGWSSKKSTKAVKPKKKKSANDFIKVSVAKPKVNMSLEYGDLKLNFSEFPPVNWLSDFIKTLK